MFVFSNLATSLDGKIATASREFHPLGTAADRKQMQVLRRRSDVIVMGASTLRTYRRFCHTAGSRRQPANAILSSALEGISPDWPFFHDPGVQRILFVTRLPPTARLERFKKTSTVILLKPPARRSPAREVLRALGRLGMKRVLVEGGGSVMWDFVKEDLIDEYHVTLTPKLVGGTEAPTLVDGKGFDPGGILDLKLKRCRRLGDELYLTYQR